MFTVLFIDRSNPTTLSTISHLASIIKNTNIKIILLSDKEASLIKDNLEIVNINDIPQNKSLVDLQSIFNFSLHKALVTERAFFDYSNFRSSERYSDRSLKQIHQVIGPYVNALDYLIRDRVDLIIEGLADNFLTSMAGFIALHYKKKFYMNFAYYWFGSGTLMADRMDQTSSAVDERYAFYMQNADQLDKKLLDLFYKQKLPHSGFKNHYSFKVRLKQVFNKLKYSYDPISVRNFLIRRVLWSIAAMKIKMLIKFENFIYDEKFILFPLHVTPEATLLGSTPELADQFALIKNISMNLPLGIQLYIKGHPAQIIGQGSDYHFYKNLKSLPNVRLYNANIDPKFMYTNQNCLAIAVLSGTVGLEGAMNRIPVFVFGRPIYHAAECFIKPKDFDEFFKYLMIIYHKKYEFNERALYAMLQALRDSTTSSEEDFTKAENWLEMSMLGNYATANFIEEQYSKYQYLRSTA